MTADEFIKQFGVKCLFHFTDLRNLSSIAEQGLLRLAELRRRSVCVVAPGGNPWSHDADTRLGLDKYVHLFAISTLWSRRQGRKAMFRRPLLFIG